MSIVCQCPSCKAKYQLGDQFAGRKIKCPKCSQVVQVPDAPLAASTPVAKTAPLDKPAAASSKTSSSAAIPVAKATPLEKSAGSSGKAGPAAAPARAVKAEPIVRPAKAAPPVAEPIAETIAAEEEDTPADDASSSDEEMAFASSTDDGFGFLQDDSPSQKQPGTRSGMHKSSVHDSNKFSGGTPARSGIGAKSSPSGARSSKTGHSPLHKKKKQSMPGWMVPAIAGGCLAVAGLIGAAVYMSSRNTTQSVAAATDAKKAATPPANANVPKLKFSFDWPEGQRSGATLTINGDVKEVPASGPVEYQLPIGQQYAFALERKGYKPIKFSRRLVESDSYITQWEAEVHGINDWEQDFDAAKKSAADQHKNVLVVFDASDTKASSFASSRFNDAIATQSEFSERAGKEYVCVYIDNPVEAPAKAKVQNIDRNHKFTTNYNIAVFPTVIVTDPRGRPFGVMEDYKINGVHAFLELMDKWQEDNKVLFALLASADESSGSPELAGKTLDFLELNKLDRFYPGTVKRLTAKLPKDEGRLATKQDIQIWENRFGLCLSNPDQVKPTVAEFDRWKRTHTIKDHDEAAKLHLMCAIILYRIHERDEAAKKCKEGLAYEPHDSQIIEGLEQFSQIVTGKPGEHHVAPVGSGTGFCIAEGNYVMTNHHVIANAKKIMVHLNGQEQKYPAHLVADNEDGDMAVLKIDLPADKSLTPIPFVASDAGIGDDVCAFGFPGLLARNLYSTLTNGLISTIHDKDGYLVTNTKIEHGNSGGPLCSITGCSIAGMVSAKTATTGQLNESYGLAIPASHLKKFLKEKLPPDVLSKIPRPTGRSGGKLSDAVKRIQPSVVYVENYQ